MPSSEVPLIKPSASLCTTRSSFGATAIVLHHRPLSRQPVMPMTALRSDFLRVLTERGFVHQCTDLQGLDALAANGSIVAYDGFDCTAPSLHIGNLVGIMMLRWLQQTGHQPIALMGGGTTKIGDPSGKDDARKLLSEADIARNMAGIRRVFANFLTFGDRPGDAIMVDNADWLDKLE